ncbi:MAG: DUF924 domain-containing protein [bacterium]|nr:DUF924 domain-containing protein [bacterium]
MWLWRPWVQFPSLAPFFLSDPVFTDFIGCFDRFPHRNTILGRASTPEKIEFLKEGGRSF